VPPRRHGLPPRGEEFLVVNAGGSLNEALSCAERLRAAVEESRIAFGTFDGRATISLGAAERSPAMESIDDLLAAADRAVYLAKSRGRNQVCTDAPPRGMRDSA
jgi:diguanylate cyclase (GGDEF)-like protein